MSEEKQGVTITVNKFYTLPTMAIGCFILSIIMAHTTGNCDYTNQRGADACFTILNTWRFIATILSLGGTLAFTIATFVVLFKKSKSCF